MRAQIQPPGFVAGLAAAPQSAQTGGASSPVSDWMIVNLEGSLWLTRLRSDSNMDREPRTTRSAARRPRNYRSREKCMNAAANDTMFQGIGAPGGE